MITAQDKILYVANKLGLTSLKNMQASTGAVYDVDTEASGVIFGNASRHQNPSITNVTQNEFEVNEALLVENISFYVLNADEGIETAFVDNFQNWYGSNAVILYDLVIGNKRVMKQTPVFGAGGPYSFADTGSKLKTGPAPVGLPYDSYVPRHQTYLEGAGILIPPQVQWSIEYRIFNVVTGDIIPLSGDVPIGSYLFGTKVLLNFNTSI
jgi:hypothetical protein